MSTLEQETQLSPFQRYLRTHFHQDDADLVQLQLEAQAAGLPAISIGPEQGKFLQPVSYTHLRAHETPEHLVCRLLLEKKKKTQDLNPILSTPY